MHNPQTFKLPLSDYQIFYDLRSKELKIEHQQLFGDTMSPLDAIKKIAQEWKEMQRNFPDRLQYFKDLALKEEQKYFKDLGIDGMQVDKLVENQKQKPKDHARISKRTSRKSQNQDQEYAEKTKKPKSAYALFVQDNQKKLTSENPDLKTKEVMKLVTERWKDLPTIERDIFEKLAAEEKANLTPKQTQIQVSPKTKKITQAHFSK